MKKSKKIFIFVLMLIIITTSFTFSSSAYSTWGNSQMISGVGMSGNKTRYYWYDTDTLNSAWRTRINDAMYAWCHTGSEGCGVYTSVWFQRTTTKSQSVIDFYDKINLPNGVYGVTSFYTGTGSNSTKVSPSADSPVNWVWAKIQVNSECCASDTYYITTTQRRAMVEHEIGHAFGLAHVSKTSRLMYPHANTCTATRPPVTNATA